MSSLSMTPPLTPVGFAVEDAQMSPPEIHQLNVEDDSRTICFNCSGAATPDNNFHVDSYWMSQFMSRIFSENVVTRITEGTLVELFGYNYEQQDLIIDQLNRLFLLIRQSVGKIQSSSTNRSMFMDMAASCNLLPLRLQIIESLDVVWKYICCGNGLTMKLLEDLYTKLHHLILHIGYLIELPSHVTMSTSCQQGNKTKSGDYHSFHLHLDVYWRLLVILYTVERKFPNFRYSRRIVQGTESDLDVPSFDQLMQLVLWDLVAIACQRYQNEVSNGDYTRVSLFSCSCVKEMWLLLVKLLEVRSQKNGGQSFWISLHQILKVVMNNRDDVTETEMDVDSNVMVIPPSLPSNQDPVSVCLWIIAHMAPLFKVRSPDPLLETRTQSNYYTVEILMKKYIHQPSQSESTLRHHLKTCLSLSTIWEPNAGILAVLWEYYYQRLNGTFQLSTSGVEGLASINQSVAGLFNQCKHLTTGQSSQEQETSFHLFLRLLALQLGRLYNDGSTPEWKQMKGRIYSKFHQRRIQNLVEVGLSNLTSLFLTLAMTTDLEDVASKLCDFYDMLDSSKITFGKRSVIWRGAFSLMLVYIEKQIDVSFLANRLGSAFENGVSDFQSAGVDTRHSLWKLLLLYLEGTQEVFDSSQGLHLSEHKLLCTSWKSLLSVCSDSELRTVLSILLTIVYRFKEVYEEHAAKTSGGTVPQQHTGIADALWINIYPFVRDHAMTLTPLPQLADLAAALCLLGLKFSPGIPLGTKDNFASVFQQFALGDNMNVSISCRFLGHLLSSTEVMERLENDLPNYQTIVIKAWFRCALQVPNNSQILTEVTRAVVQLEQVRAVFILAESEIPDNLDLAPVYFLKAIERAHRKIQSWKERMEFRDKVMSYFCDVSKHVAMVIRNQGPPEAFSNVYKMAGYMVKYCAPLLFIESKPDCPLPSIINSMIVPHHVLNPDKPLQPTFLAVIRDTLHLFVQGLGKLDYKKSPYVQRRLKDIVTLYLPKFPLKSILMTSVATSVHPIVASLSSSYIQQVPDEALRFREFILQLVISNFVVVKNMAVHPAHSVGISFVHEVMQRSTNKEVLARDTVMLLPCCLDYLLLLPETSSSLTAVTYILSTLLEAYQQNTQVLPLSSLSGTCEKFIEMFFKFSSDGVIKVMEKLAVLQVDLVISVVKKLSSCVHEIEVKRGVGVDKRLRLKYYKLLKILGPVGETEILQLQSEGT